MAIETVNAYQCICDKCGKGYNTEGDDWPMVWINKDDLLTWLGTDEDNWKHIGEGWYCSSCIEWDEEETELIVKLK